LPRKASAVSGAEFTQRVAFSEGRLLAALARHEAATPTNSKSKGSNSLKVASSKVHETRAATLNLSDEGIDDTFV